jgi:hypothetical protein
VVRNNEEAVRHALAVRMASSYGAEQIAPNAWAPSPYRHRPEIDAKLLLGRRSDYGQEENKFRNGIYEKTNRGVDIIAMIESWRPLERS